VSTEPDLFVICKNCSSEVSPYITECPYCGHRLRKRAPKIERSGQVKRPRGAKVRRQPRVPSLPAFAVDETRRPYATLILLGASLFFVLLVVFIDRTKLGLVAHLSDDPWRAVTSVFVYDNVWYQLAALLAIGVYGWRLELRHGPMAVLTLFLLGGVGGMVAVSALDSTPFAYGGNGLGLALLVAWAIPDLLRRRTGEDYDGDLLGTLVIAILLIAMSAATTEASITAAVTGIVAGLVVGLVLARVAVRRPG
jgi:membrane associated rhomboid family serine protease